MYLKSLALRGFKSFASATTLVFEPGITAVVGPNGSGKSNVVDAIAWVLGEQGAKALRGGKMEDVIFAGTSGRAPLGRAEVTLTIDNSDGALPIEYSEVALTRRMYRDGISEYEINGSSCRLLDIQELLSDSGIGREMHVIVGQGQLDAVLSARPEDRRAFIEEAAGVLKHRKRKEKALRKLDAMQANLTRLTDLTGELRRQLKPLGRQAEVAKRALTIQSDLRDARLRLLADDLVTLRTRVELDTRAEREAASQRERVSAALSAATAQQDLASETLAAAAPAVQTAQDTWFALSALAERFRSTIELAEERARNLRTVVEEPRSGRDPEQLEAAAETAEREQQAKQQSVDVAQAALVAAVDVRGNVETRLKGAEAELLAATRAIADRREGLATLNGKVHAARSKLAAVDDEITRLTTALANAEQRAAAASAEYSALELSVGELGDAEVSLDDTHERSTIALERADARVRELVDAQRAGVSEQRSLQARLDALTLAGSPRDGTAALLGADGPDGILGPVAALLSVEPGYEAAIAAALGAAAEAVAVADVGAATDALGWLRESAAGRASLLVGGDAGLPETSVELPRGAVAAAGLVRSTDTVRPAVQRLLAGTVVVADLAAARTVVTTHPGLRAVTRDGDVVGPDMATGGPTGRQSALEIQAATDDARSRLAAVTETLAELEAGLDGARAEAVARAADRNRALEALNASDASLSAVAEQLGHLAESRRAAIAEAERLVAQRTSAESSRSEQAGVLRTLESRLANAQAEEVPTAIDTSIRDRLLGEAERARQAELEARLALRTVEERARATAGTAEGLRRAARAEREARARAEATRMRRQVAAAVAAKVTDRAGVAADKLAATLALAAAERDGAVAGRAAAEEAVSVARRHVAELSREWEHLTSEVHREELARAQQQIRLDALAEKATVEFGITVDDLVAEYGPHLTTPPSEVELAEYRAARDRGESVYAPQPLPFDRGATERIVRKAEGDLAFLGKVNPLALEEFAALEERHAFLSTQLADLKDTRRDLLTVVDEVDAKILEVFTTAYHDVAREFRTVFATLFPGGEGELVLTDPENMLLTGIEVNARPPGKKIRRLSLLSGGERSLTAVAMLVAIFRARPSPFYVLDEVEAALDEVNLTRLVSLLAELRESSQLIVITHQKFTMEAADALYGVSMRGDGITQVISQRIRGMVPA